MTATLLTPDLRRILDDLARRIGILERRIRGEGASADDAYEIIFSYAGTLTGSESPPARPWRAANLTVVAVTLGTAGSTSTVLNVERNGLVVGTVTVPASTTVHNGDVFARFAADADKLTLVVVTVGTGAADMTAAARFV